MYSTRKSKWRDLRSFLLSNRALRRDWAWKRKKKKRRRIPKWKWLSSLELRRKSITLQEPYWTLERDIKFHSSQKQVRVIPYTHIPLKQCQPHNKAQRQAYKTAVFLWTNGYSNTAGCEWKPASHALGESLEKGCFIFMPLHHKYFIFLKEGLRRKKLSRTRQSALWESLMFTLDLRFVIASAGSWGF